MAKKCYVGVDNFKTRTLPSGYTQIDYIESSGTQYIDTGFKPNQDTKFVIDCYFLESNTGTDHHIASVNNSSQYYALRAKADLTGFAHRYYNTALANVASDSLYGRHTFVRDKNKTSIDSGTQTTATYGTFQITNTLPISCFKNASGATSGFSKLRIYSCYIYDNGTLVRDFVPCKNSGGVAGLYDLVNGVFYTDAAGGSFAAGATHGYKAREVKKMRTGVSNVARNVRKGYIGVNNVARLFFQGGLKLREYNEGDIVYLNESGKPVAFYVAKHNYESGLNGAGRTLLVRKDCYDKRGWNDASGGSNTYATCDLNKWFNNTYVKLFDSDVQSAISTTKFSYTVGGKKATVQTLSRSVFALSVTELNVTYSYANTEGSALPIAEILKIAYYGGSAVDQLTRSADKRTDREFYLYVKKDGTASNSWPNYNYYSRPAFTLPETTAFDASTNEFLGV